MRHFTAAVMNIRKNMKKKKTDKQTNKKKAKGPKKGGNLVSLLGSFEFVGITICSFDLRSFDLRSFRG